MYFHSLLTLSLFTTTVLAAAPDPACLKAVHRHDVVMVAEQLHLEPDNTLFIDFTDGTVIVTPNAVFPAGADYLEALQDERRRGYEAVAAIVRFNKVTFLTLTTGYLIDGNGQALHCVTAFLKPQHVP